MALGQRLNLKEVAISLRDGVIAHYAAAVAADPAVKPLPARRFLNPGDPAVMAWDCEQLAVSYQGTGYGQSNDASPLNPQVGAGTSVFNVRHTIYEVAIVRCVAGMGNNGEAPSALELEETAVTMLDDAGLLSQALVEIASQVRQGLPRHGKVQAGEVLPAGPEGNMVAVVGLFQITTMDLR